MIGLSEMMRGLGEASDFRGILKVIFSPEMNIRIGEDVMIKHDPGYGRDFNEFFGDVAVFGDSTIDFIYNPVFGLGNDLMLANWIFLQAPNLLRLVCKIDDLSQSQVDVIAQAEQIWTKTDNLKEFFAESFSLGERIASTSIRPHKCNATINETSNTQLVNLAAKLFLDKKLAASMAVLDYLVCTRIHGANAEMIAWFCKQYTDVGFSGDVVEKWQNKYKDHGFVASQLFLLNNAIITAKADYLNRPRELDAISNKVSESLSKFSLFRYYPTSESSATNMSITND